MSVIFISFEILLTVERIFVLPEFFGINPINDIRSSFLKASSENFGGIRFSSSRRVISSLILDASTSFPSDLSRSNLADSFGARPVRCNRRPLALMFPQSFPERNIFCSNFFSVAFSNLSTACIAPK